MKNYGFESVNLTKGYFFDKYELNRKITIDAVYDRFAESGRIEAFKFNWTPDREDLKKPHFFWDSDVAKWMEGAAYLLKKAPNPELEKKIDDIVAEIKKNQCEDGYFNIYFTTDTVHRILPRNGVMLIQLSYIFNYQTSMLTYS